MFQTREIMENIQWEFHYFVATEVPINEREQVNKSIAKHGHKTKKNSKVNLYNNYIKTDNGLLNFLKSTEKETVLLLG